MTKAVVIEIDLGIDVDKLISDDVLEITAETKEQLRTVVAVAKQSQELRTKEINAKQIREEQISTRLAEIYDKLLAAGDDGLSADELRTLAHPVITNASSLTLMLKTKLRKTGNRYVLAKHGQRYYLESYNQSIDDEIAEYN